MGVGSWQLAVGSWELGVGRWEGEMGGGDGSWGQSGKRKPIKNFNKEARKTGIISNPPGAPRAGEFGFVWQKPDFT